MDDVINRQAAIDAAIEAADEWDGGYSITRENMIADAINNIAPSTQPESQWIPCSERMPEEHEWLGTKRLGTTISDEVYVTFENPKGERFCRHMTFQNGELSRYDKIFMENWYKDSNPIAWMPLPKPYKRKT